MKVFNEVIDFNIINSPEFKEDSVREAIIVPILEALGYSTFGENKIVRSKGLEHPYVQFGTSKKHIKIIPDYLLQVQGEYVFVLDAKAPGENIVSGENVEQAYSYAIHREIRSNIYVLCNGVELTIFRVDKKEPIKILRINQIEEKWREVESILSPLAFSKPHVFTDLPDYGMKLVTMSYPLEQEMIYIGIQINCLIKVSEDIYTFSGVISFEKEVFLASFDFHKSLLLDFINCLPLEKKDKVMHSISNYPFKIDFPIEEGVVEINFKAKMGEFKIYDDLVGEQFFPLEIVTFL